MSANRANGPVKPGTWLVGQTFGSWQFGNVEHAKPSTFDAGGQESARMQSLPLYEAKPATLVARQSARMSLFIVIDLRDWAHLKAPGPRRR